jgi:type II secretory pathway pseudopilin PulG
LLTVVGVVIALLFVTQTVVAMVQRETGWFEFWSWVAAAETAAWRVKWVSLPVMFVALWFGARIYRSIRLQPARFCGLKYARSGLMASATVAFLIALLIGVTIPERLRQREMAKDAAQRAYYWTFETAAAQYRQRYQTYPASFEDLRERIPDPYGTLAEALNNLDPNGYTPHGEIAEVTIEKSRTLRGAVVRNASGLSAPTDDTAPTALAFTKFELRLPGEDKIFGNDDDWIGRDGMIMRYSDIAKGGVGRSAGALQQ